MPSSEHEMLVDAFLANPMSLESLDGVRAEYDAMLSATEPAAETLVESIDLDGVPAEWVSQPESKEDRAILYLHGGGYMIGSSLAYREFASRIAGANSARVLVLDYRLAPENPFPAAVEDALSAYHYLLNQGLSPEQISIAGDSAGGGLAIALLLTIRDSGGQLPACATCFSPWLDMECSGDSCTSGLVSDPIVSVDNLTTMAESYAANDKRNALASPLLADLTGLPPLKLFVGTREVLLDDSLRFAEKAKSVGVDVTLTIENDLVHVWPVFAIPEAAVTLVQMGEFTTQYIT